MKKETTPAREFLIGTAAQMRSDAAKEFLAAAAAGDDSAFQAALLKGEAARSTLRQQQGHALHKDVASAIGIDLKSDPKTS